ncbi:MAG: FtsW/RodA/SpoVE family cell cycle protein [Oscillospiraceae bacterium]
MKYIFKAIYNYIKETDKTLITLCMLVSTFSVFLLSGIYKSGLLASKRQILVQIAAAVIGLISAIIMSKIDYKIMARLWKLHSALAYTLVILTFFIGIKVSDFVDDRAWLPLPFGLTLQPSELLKISFIVTFALHLQKESSNINNPKSLFFLCLHAAVPIILVMSQGDHGTALIFIFIFLSMLFAAGLSFKYIIPAVALGILCIPIGWHYLLSDDKKMRILSIFNPALDPEGVGWQQMKGLLSIGSGQLWGSGLFAGKHHYVPELYNDFIFAFVGEALGFVGCISLIVILSFIVLKILMIIPHSNDLLGKYICVGVFAMFAFQILLNIGMCISVLPVIGITLPFVSAGGTSIVASYLGIGLALSVYMHNHSSLFVGK